MIFSTYIIIFSHFVNIYVLKIFDIRTKAEVVKLNGHRQRITSLSSWNNEPQIISASHDHTGSFSSFSFYFLPLSLFPSFLLSFSSLLPLSPSPLLPPLTF